MTRFREVEVDTENTDSDLGLCRCSEGNLNTLGFTLRFCAVSTLSRWVVFGLNLSFRLDDGLESLTCLQLHSLCERFR